MKHLFTLLAIAALSLASQKALASGLVQKSPGDQAALQAQFGEMNRSASEFAALTPKEIIKKTGKKMSWGEKILFKITQKRIKKQLAKGVQPSSAEGEAGSSSKLGLISLILAGVGLLMFILVLSLESLGGVFLFGLICGSMALVLGIIGLIKDEKKAAAIIGTALSIIVLLLLVGALGLSGA